MHWVTELVLSGGAGPRRLGQRRDKYLPKYWQVLESISIGYDRLAPERVADVQARVLELHALAGRARFSASEVFLPLTWWRVAVFVVRELEVLLVAGPIALFGYLNHLPAYLGTRAIVSPHGEG